MSHSPHHTLPGYSPNQILIDGCYECEARSAQRGHGLDNLDGHAFEHAWYRAAAHGKRGLADASVAEIALLNALWSVQVQLERRGVPIGHLPSGELIIGDAAARPVGCADHMVIDCPDCAPELGETAGAYGIHAARTEPFTRCPICQIPGHAASAHTDFS